MATIGKANQSSEQNTSRRSYITTDNYQSFFYTYKTGNKGVGILLPVTTNPELTPSGRILRETGRKVYPGANSGVSNYMVSVYDSVSLLNGFIDPNARVFAIYNMDKPNFLPNDLNTIANQYGGMYGPSILTGGNILQISQDVSGNITQSYMGVQDKISSYTKYAALYQYDGDDSMVMEAYDTITGQGAYLNSKGDIIATNGIGYYSHTNDTQTSNILNTVHSSSNAPTGFIHLSSNGSYIPAYEARSFTLYNSTIGANDYLSIQYSGGFEFPGYFSYSANCPAPSTAVISILNHTPSDQAPSSISLQYILFKTSPPSL